MKRWVQGLLLVVAGKVFVAMIVLFGIIVMLSTVAQMFTGGSELGKEFAKEEMGKLTGKIGSIWGSDDESLNLVTLSQSWQDEIEWTHPETGSKIKGLTPDLKAQIAQFDLGISPGVLWAFTQMERCDEECLIKTVKDLSPAQVVITAIDPPAAQTVTPSPSVGVSSSPTPAPPTPAKRILLSSVTTYRGVFTIHYNANGEVQYVEKKTDYQRLAEVMKGLGLDDSDEDVSVLLTMAKMYDPNLQDVKIYDPNNNRVETEVDLEPNALFAWPVPSLVSISSDFGFRRNPIDGSDNEFHKGIDIPCGVGTEIVAAADGVVEFAGWGGTAGNMIILAYDNGYKSRYLHLSKISVSTHERVVRGDAMGESGDTGSTKGAHLHFEIIANGEPVNPMVLFNGDN